jgi:hypothetical protein
MKFLDWLFDRNRETDTFQGSENEFLPGPKKFQPIPKWTHAGKKGKKVYCPKCGGETHVYHFSWTALQCGACHASLNKSEWLMPVKPVIYSYTATSPRGEVSVELVEPKARKKKRGRRKKR